jgi:hypothetical protein
MTASVQDILVNAFMRTAGHRFRVDTYDGPCQWWRQCADGTFIPVTLTAVWDAARHGTRQAATNLFPTTRQIAMTIKMAQHDRYVALLTFDEWNSRRSAPAHWQVFDAAA